MAKFMDVHDGFFGVTAQQLAEAHQRDLDIEGDEGVHYEHAWLDPEAGKVFCLASGPSKETVMRGLDEPSLAESLRRQHAYPGYMVWRNAADTLEGPRAFAEKRPPRWRGM